MLIYFRSKNGQKCIKYQKIHLLKSQKHPNRQLQEQVLQIMIKNFEDKELKEKDLREFNNICEECKKEHESVSQNLILIGYKWCESCRTSKTVFPIQLILLTGRALILLMTKDTDKIAIIKKDKNTMPKDFKFDLRFKICFKDTIKEAKIHN